MCAFIAEEGRYPNSKEELVNSHLKQLSLEEVLLVNVCVK
jgi:hypothetical protein